MVKCGGKRESPGERSTPHVHNDWIGRTGCTFEQHAERLRQFLQVSGLVEVRIEEDAVSRRQVVPWFIKVSLSPTDDVAKRHFARDTKQRFANRPIVILHAIDDLGAPQFVEPLGKLDGHLTLLKSCNHESAHRSTTKSMFGCKGAGTGRDASALS